jgi:hypothetical protein
MMHFVCRDVAEAKVIEFENKTGAHNFTPGAADEEYPSPESHITWFGHRKVHDALTPLINKCAFQDWQCVANAVDRLARKARKRTTNRR